MNSLETLTEMIQRGWGDTRQDRIPANWREIDGPAITGAKVRRDVDGYAVWVDPLEAERLSITPEPERLSVGQQALLNERQRKYQRRRSWEQRIMERAAGFTGYDKRRRQA